MTDNIESIDQIEFDIKYLEKVLKKHSHRSCEIVLMLDGSLSYFVKDRPYILKPNDILFINENEFHQNLTTETKKYKAIMTRFAKDFIHSLATRAVSFNLFYPFFIEHRAINLDQENFEIVSKLFQKMIQEYHDNDPGCLIYCRALLSELLVTINRILLKNPYSTDVWHPNHLHKKIYEISSYIGRNYMNAISLDKISKEFYISPYYLSRTFKEMTGFSFIEYINLVRIDSAQELLRETDNTITLVGEKAGFNSITHFSRSFKRITGISPKEYRNIKIKEVLSPHE